MWEAQNAFELNREAEAKALADEDARLERLAADTELGRIKAEKILAESEVLSNNHAHQGE